MSYSHAASSAGIGPENIPAAGQDARSGQPAVDRLRLLSYVGRWGRVRRWLPAGNRMVIDVGCAHGYGTVALKGSGKSQWRVIGLEHDTDLVRAAARRYPWLVIVNGDAAALPFASGSADAIVILDVLEHLAHPSEILAEIVRVLRPGGDLILSTPHRGLLARLDANNLYLALRRRWQSLPPLETYDDSATGEHRHFTLDEIQATLGPEMTVVRASRTGLGIVEVFHLIALLLFKALLPWPRAYVAFRQLHFFGYLVEDLIPSGALGYHLTVMARRGDVDQRSMTNEIREASEAQIQVEVV